MSKVRYCNHCGMNEDASGQSSDDWTELVLSKPGNEVVPIVGMRGSPADLCGRCTSSFLSWYESRP